MNKSRILQELASIRMEVERGPNRKDHILEKVELIKAEVLR